MYIDADFIEQVLKTTTPALLPLPTSTSSGHHHTSVAPIPTVLPEPSWHPEVRSATGERTLWVVFVVMFISSLVNIVLGYRQPVSKRLFHVLTSFITIFATFSYFAMASGQGITFNTQHRHNSHKHGIPDTHEIAPREVYYARYVDWTLTTPLLLLDLGLLAGLNGADLLVAIVADLAMVITGLFAAVSERRETSWAWYAMACAAYLVIVYIFAVNGRAVVKTKDSKTGALFGSLALFTFVLWTAYPIVWGVADGSRIVGVDGEIIAYAVLDILAKPIFGFWLLFSHDSNQTSTESIGGFWSHGLSREGAIRVGDEDEA